MAYGTHPPEFDLTAFWWASVDLIANHTIYLALFVATVGGLLTLASWHTYLWIVLRQQKAQDLREIKAELDAIASEDHRRMSAVVNITEHRVGGRPQW